MSSEDEFEDCVDHKEDNAEDASQEDHHHEEDKFQEPGKFRN